MTKRPIMRGLAIFLASCIGLAAGERTIPVDMYILIDKSLSMAEPGKYESLHAWVRDQLLDQMLIEGDSITLYQFYGKAERILSRTVNSNEDKTAVRKAINAIHPDGQYTDIGLALDTLKQDLDKRPPSDRFTILFLLTDLKHEAPWTSRYAGEQEGFTSPYLAQARILQHDAWYEITLDMDIQDKVVMTSKELYSTIQETRGTAAAVVDNGDLYVSADGSSDPGSNLDAMEGQSGKARPTDAKPLPQYLIPVIVSITAFALAGIAVIVAKSRSRKKEDDPQRTGTRA